MTYFLDVEITDEYFSMMAVKLRKFSALKKIVQRGLGGKNHFHLSARKQSIQFLINNKVQLYICLAHFNMN